MFENQNFESPRSVSEEKENESLKEKLHKAATLGLVAVTALAGEACAPEKGGSEYTSGSGTTMEVKLEQNLTPDPASLAEYYKNIHEGHFPSKGQEKRITARAIEIAIRKGIRVGRTSRITTEARGTVPVAIQVDGQVVPVGPSDYTAEELRLVRAIESISASMGNASDGQRTSQPELKSGMYVAPDLKDFIDNDNDLKDFIDGDNKPEKRESKSDF